MPSRIRPSALTCLVRLSCPVTWCSLGEKGPQQLSTCPCSSSAQLDGSTWTWALDRSRCHRWLKNTPFERDVGCQAADWAPRGWDITIGDRPWTDGLKRDGELGGRNGEKCLVSLETRESRHGGRDVPTLPRLHCGQNRSRSKSFRKRSLCCQKTRATVMF